mgnify:FL=1
MQVFLDDQPLTVEPKTVARAIDVARSVAEGQGRFVIDVVGDGAPVRDELLEAPPEDDAGIGELRMRTADPTTMIPVTLHDVAEALEQTRAQQAEAASCFQRGESTEGGRQLSQALDTWQMARDIVAKAGALSGVDPASVTFSHDGADLTGAECIESLRSLLDQLKSAVRSDGASEIADLLAIDFEQEVGRWQAFAHAFARRVATG